MKLKSMAKFTLLALCFGHVVYRIINGSRVTSHFQFYFIGFYREHNVLCYIFHLQHMDVLGQISSVYCHGFQAAH